MEKYNIKDLSQNEKWEIVHGRFKMVNNPPFRQTHGLQEGTDEDAYYVPNPLYRDLQKAGQNLVLKLERLNSKKESIKQKYFTLKRKRTWEQYLKQKLNSKVFDVHDEGIKELNQVREKLKETPQTVAYTKEDGTTYTKNNI